MAAPPSAAAAAPGGAAAAAGGAAAAAAGGGGPPLLWTVEDVPTDAAHARLLHASRVAGPPRADAATGRVVLALSSGGDSASASAAGGFSRGLFVPPQQPAEGAAAGGGGDGSDLVGGRARAPSYGASAAAGGESEASGTGGTGSTTATTGRPRRFQKPLDPSKRWHEVDMSNVGLRVLSPAALAGVFDHLTHLHLSHNKLQALPPGVFSVLKQLVHLDVSHNELVTLPPSINQLQNLLRFDLRANSLQELPVELGHLIHLQTLLLDQNPMLHTPPAQVAAMGTDSVILWLRERMPIGSPPPPRDWLPVPQAFAAPNQHMPRFSVMCFNILADPLATQEAYPYAASWMLDWNYRKKGVLKEIVTTGCDVVCLQECEQGAFQEYFKPELAKHGFEGFFGAKSRSKTMDEWSAMRVDGCATFWRTAKFRKADDRSLEYQSLVLQRGRDMFDTSSPDQQEAMQRLMTKDNIATVVLLQHVEEDEYGVPPPETPRFVAVANTHIHWNPEFCDVKLIQTQMLTEQLEELTLGTNSNHPTLKVDAKTTGRHAGWQGAPIVLCGDLNSQPDEGPYRLLASGQLPGTHADLKGFTYGTYSKHGMRHALRLRSSYSTLATGEPTFTNYTAGFVGTLDYIFFSESALRASRILAPVAEEVVSQSCLPNAFHASDHISIAADFLFLR